MDCEIGHFIPPTDRAAKELICKPRRYPFEKAERKFIVADRAVARQDSAPTSSIFYWQVGAILAKLGVRAAPKPRPTHTDNRRRRHNSAAIMAIY